MRHDGFTLIELLIVIAILSALMLLAVPAIQSGASEVAMRGAAQSAASTFVRARLLAVQSSRETAVRIESDASGYRLLIYQDGNGNGVRTAEIASGRDRLVPAGAVWNRNDIRIGIFGDAPVPDPSNPRVPLARTSDPVRFNNSNLCSFSPFGESTPGSLYLTDNRRRMAVIRVASQFARVHVLYFTKGDTAWHP